jgi:cytochrome c peroxidase
MSRLKKILMMSVATAVSIGGVASIVRAQTAAVQSSYTPTQEEPLSTLMPRLIGEKPEFALRQKTLLESRYDLGNHPGGGTMSKGKPIQDGVRVKLAPGTSWDSLAQMTPEEIQAKGVFPQGFLPLPHPHHEAGGMVFPHFQIDEIKRQEGRDLTRFDLDFDLPDHFLPEFPAPIYLTTRPDLGDVSHGQLVTNQNYYDLFNGILNPKQLDGLRLLTSPFAQQQFNLTADRRSAKPSMGVSCLDCHANGHTNAATHTVGDIRPNEFRHRIDTPSLRGVNVQRLFGSQRGLKTVEDFTEFEQRAAYFDGDPVIAMKKGVNFLDRAGQVQSMAEFLEILDFPPAPKLNSLNRLDVTKATPQELRGEAIFIGKGQCAVCHTPENHFTDNSMHDLHLERFYKPQMHNGVMASADGPIKTFPLRGIKDSPPYLHDDRLLTLDDTVEFFNLVLGTHLTAPEKKDLVAYLKTL